MARNDQLLNSSLPVARILDANLNRVAEGLRVVEDYLRFAWNDAVLLASTKSIRHDFGEIARAIPPIWVARDAAHDVGRTIATPQEQQRSDATAVLMANLKRIEQGLRSLEEWCKTDQSEMCHFAGHWEQLRYRTYQLEANLRRSWLSRKRLADRWLYVLIDGADSAKQFRERVNQLVTAGVHLIQLRDKQLSDVKLLERARQLRTLTDNTDTLCLVNDRADIAVAAEADGLHLGQDDLPITEARQIVGPNRLIGRSTHDMSQLQQAVVDGADYVGVGPVFPSQTKQFQGYPGVEFAAAAVQATELPAFAIGGITADHLPELQRHHVSRFAVGHAIWRSDQVGQACRAFLRCAITAAALLMALSPHVARGQQLGGGKPVRTSPTPHQTTLPSPAGQFSKQRSAPHTPHQPDDCLCELENSEIAESSGLALGRHPVRPLWFWTHNDSGDQPRLFAFDERGQHLGTSQVQHAELVDWEDMGSFVWKGTAYLFVADVGDNVKDRKHCTVYVAREPKMPNEDTIARAITFVYEDGPRDCEAVAFDVRTKSFLLVEKSFSLTSRVYQLPWPKGDDSLTVARPIGLLPIPVVTGMDISADGLRLVCTTYGNGYEIRREPDDTWRAALRRQGRVLSFPARRQGETVCYGPDASTVYLTSEKKPCPLFAVCIDESAGQPVHESR